MNKVIYIIDIKKKQNSNFSIKNLINEDAAILSLTPYSSYLLDCADREYKTFHELISINDFKKKIFEIYDELEKVFQIHQDFSYIFRNLALVKNYEIFINVLFEFINEQKKNNYKIIYITDTEKKPDITKFNFVSNENSGFLYNKSIDEFRYTHSKDKYFYILMKIKSIAFKIIYDRNLFFKIKSKFLKQKNTYLTYDNMNFYNFWEKTTNQKVLNLNFNYAYDLFVKDISSVLIQKGAEKFIVAMYEKTFDELRKEIINQSNINEISLKPFVYLSNDKDFVTSLIYKKNNIPSIFMQHGSYHHNQIFLLYSEIMPASINFVINEYTKNIFLKNNAKAAHAVGSINFNKKIINRYKKYDFIYITHCTLYSYSATYVDSKDSWYAMDGNNIYKKHKNIIELFGEKFIHQSICIKMQPAIVDSMFYVPLLELSKKYKNVKIEFFEPLHRLIEKSQYIISDYFSSEFMNRELHYKRDIILFNSEPLKLPEETLEDMQKMFILVDTVNDLRDKVENIVEITKNRKRYDDIIEYYSSKKCDTKKVVIEILEKELNGK
ncbi:MAG: hypothetical protein WC665_09055 [Sulfurimonas sp.]|jgi:hypothetical protein